MGACMSAVDEQLLSSLQPQFDALQLRPGEVRKLYRLFMKVDIDHSGSISLKELMRYLEMGETIFRDRVFSIFDEDNSGNIDFREFVLSLWNYCTLSRATLDLFAFDLYDTDSNGELSSEEIDGMLHDLYGADVHSHPAAKMVFSELKHIYLEHSFGIEKFQSFVKTHPSLLFPAFQLQHALRQKILGVRFWERASERRIRLTEGRFIPVADFVQLNVNSLAYNVGLKSISDSRVDENAKFVFANTGTHHYRHQHAAVTDPSVPQLSPGAGITNANKLSLDIPSVRQAARSHGPSTQGSPERPSTHSNHGADRTPEHSAPRVAGGSPVPHTTADPSAGKYGARNMTKEHHDATASQHSALDKVFNKLLKDQEISHAATFHLGSTSSNNSRANTPTSSLRKVVGGHRQEVAPTDTHSLISPDSFLLNQPQQSRHTVKPTATAQCTPEKPTASRHTPSKGHRVRERERRHTVDQRPGLSPQQLANREDVRNQLHDSLVKRVAAHVAEDNKASASLYGRRPTLP